MKHSITGSLAIVVAAMLVGGNSFADESLGVQDDFAALGAMETQQLDELRGRSGDVSINVQSIQELQAKVTGGVFVADTIATGGISIGEHALDNFGGVGLFNFVTGNNNAVNGAIGVSIYLQ